MYQPKPASNKRNYHLLGELAERALRQAPVHTQPLFCWTPVPSSVVELPNFLGKVDNEFVSGQSISARRIAVDTRQEL